MLHHSSERVEMVVDIYESIDPINYKDSNTKKEDADAGREKSERCLQAQHRGGVTAWSRCNRLTAVCVVLLCVLLFVVSTVLWIKFNNLVTENNQQQPSYNNLTKGKDELQTRYNNLTIERDQLQTSYNNLTKEKDQLQNRYNNLTIERDQLQRERDLCKWKWINFNSRFYNISNEKKTWEESRQDCREKGADLIIINNKEEQEFISKHISNRGVWIGLSDKDKEGEWKWVDDSPLTFKSWGSGEPGGNKTENCGEIYKSSNTIIWNDKNCSTKQNWICERGFSP